MLLSLSFVSGFQQIAGTLVIDAPIGGTGSAKYGLINDGEESITVKLRVDGDISRYISFPETVDLEHPRNVWNYITPIFSRFWISTDGNYFRRTVNGCD